MTAILDLGGVIAADQALWQDFEAICECGGRLAGTESERRAFAHVTVQAQAATGVAGHAIPIPYGGWSARAATVTLACGAKAACQPLVRSVATPPGGLEAEVVDLGRGTAEEFEAPAEDIKGRLVVV